MLFCGFFWSRFSYRLVSAPPKDGKHTHIDYVMPPWPIAAVGERHFAQPVFHAIELLSSGQPSMQGRPRGAEPPAAPTSAASIDGRAYHWPSQPSPPGGTFFGISDSSAGPMNADGRHNISAWQVSVMQGAVYRHFFAHLLDAVAMMMLRIGVMSAPLIYF